MKHYTNLSQMNFGVDNGLYPLGSCTMKYNPKFCDQVAALPSVTSVHPNQEGGHGARFPPPDVRAGTGISCRHRRVPARRRPDIGLTTRSSRRLGSLGGAGLERHREGIFGRPIARKARQKAEGHRIGQKGRDQPGRSVESRAPARRASGPRTRRDRRGGRPRRPPRRRGAGGRASSARSRWPWTTRNCRTGPGDHHERKAAKKAEHGLQADHPQKIGGRHVAGIGERLAWQHRSEEMSIGIVDAGRATLGQVGHDVGRLEHAALQGERVDEGLQRAAG